MRITTGMISKQYTNNLNEIVNQLNEVSTTAYDYRSFEKPSDDPFLAGQTYQIRRQLSANENYSSNIQSIQAATSSAETSLQTVSSTLINANSSSVLEAITGTSNQEDRDSIADTLLSMRDSLVSDMNAQYGNRYLFSGAGGYGEAPFSVDDSGNLLYRGINVDTGENSNGASTTISYDYTDARGTTTEKSMQINFGTGIDDELNDYNVSISTGGTSNSVSVDTTGKTISITMKADATKQDLQDLLQGANGDTTFSDALNTAGITSISTDDLSQITISNIDEVGTDTLQASTGSTTITNIVDLDDLANETSYVDIGIGMETDSDGNVVDQSAYNSAMPGINYLGYGTTTEDGVTVPNNVYSLMTEMASILKDSSLSGETLMDKIQPYMDAFSNTQDEFDSQLATLGTDEQFLTSTATYITNVNTNLTTQDEDVEYVDVTDAISDYAMQMFCYTAALQVGSNLLQPTLLDYMS